MDRRQIEDVYRLSPVQQGMLFHSLEAPGSGVYVEQFVSDVRRAHSPENFTQALQLLTDRNPILRTSFLWEDLEAPVQVVHRQVAAVLTTLDLRGLDPAELAERQKRFLDEDRRRGFDLTRAPLLRVALIRVSEEVWRRVFTYHHAILDGFSNNMIALELGALLVAIEKGLPVPPPPGRRPFRDFIAWLSRIDMAAAERYWRQTLAGFREPTPLGIERATRGSGQRDPGERDSRWRIVCSAEELAHLQGWCRQHRLTLGSVLHAAWALLLSRYSDREDVVFGTTVFGRPASLPGADRMYGCFINTIPVRARLPEERPLVAWLRELQGTLVEARSYEHSPLVEVQGWSEVPRPAPLFDSVLVIEQLNEAYAVDSEEHFQRTNSPLTLVIDLRKVLAVRIDFLTGRIDGNGAERLLSHLGRVLAAWTAEGLEEGQPLGRIDVLLPAERLALTARAEARPATANLASWFERQVARTPSAPAVAWQGESWSYAELNARANRVAHALRRRGVGPEVRVGLCMERSGELIAGLLGILKAGGAYVPLDPDYPASRLAFLIGDSGLAWVVSAGTAGVLLAPLGDRVVNLDALDAELAAASPENPPAVSGPENLAYVIYTSGSTGVPKGSLVTHGNVARLMTATEEWFGFGGGDVWSLFHSFAFDFSVWEIWGALLYGGRLVVVPWEVSRSPAAFLQLLSAERVTVLNQTPSAFRQLVQSEADSPVGPLALRTVIFGGEALDPMHLAPWFERHGDRVPQLVNMYGITETTVHVTWRPITRGDLLPEASGSPIGIPIPDLQLLLLDRQLRPVPAGVPGEMCVAGGGLARGYLGRPELTAERFVPNPYGEPGDRLYRSGDLARRLENGELDYLGRRDNQVKIRGFRIELGEIESALNAFPGVRDSAVVALGSGDERKLVAYVVPADPASAPAAGELRGHLRQQLPDYMVPALYVPLPALPLTHHGKLDRRALPDPAADGAGGDDLRTPVETIVAAIWCEVLGISHAGRQDNFFELGGHSLLATRVLSRLRGAFQVEISMGDLFAQPSLADLAERIEILRQGALTAVPPLARRPLGAREEAPLSFSQEGLWFLDRLQPGAAVYNVPLAVRLTGRLQPAALAAALAGVARRHEALRTVFAVGEAGPVQRVLPEPWSRLGTVDLGGLPAAIREVEVGRLLRESMRLPFDLATGPLLRHTLLAIGPEAHVLAMSCHHIVADGWSMAILLRELIRFYAAATERRLPDLPALPIQYADFAGWQRDWLAGEALQARLEPWRRTLAGATPFDLPTDRPRRNPTGRGAALPRALPAAVAAPLQTLSRRSGATLFMTLLAGFGMLLSRYAGREDLVLGTPVAGRARPELEGLIGFFVNSLALRLDLAGDPSFETLLARVRATCLAAYDLQDLPFERLVAELQPERDLSRSPLFQVMFQLQNNAAATAAETALPGLKLAPVAIEAETSKLDLILNATEAGSEIALLLRYSTDLFEPATAARLLDHLGVLFAGIAAGPGRRLSELPLLTAAETAELRAADRLGAAEAFAGPGLHERFSARAAADPTAIAVTWGSDRLTYGDLEARANRLARFLQGRGILPGALVGIFLDRSLDLVTAILAVLKAGGAYLPLDPDYPASRLAFLLEDSRTPLVLTREELRERLPESAAAISLDGEAERIATESPKPPGTRVSGIDPAYVIYTSGSTGQPKGVVVRHGNVTRLFEATENWFHFGAGDVWTLFHSYAFDFSVWEIWGALLYGGRLVVVPYWLSRSPVELRELLERERVTVLNQTPSAFRQLAWADAERPSAALDLRWVIFGGEALELQSLAPWIERYGDERPRLINMYGITETTVHVTYREIRKADLEAGRGSVIGEAIPDLALHLLDARGNLVPPGVPGEIHVGGPGLAQGYLARPALTAERFVPDPFSLHPGARLYRSGDLARWRAAAGRSELEYLGRIDHQVKIRGFRIELGEIEAALAAFPGVREAVVLARPEAEGEGLRLVAYLGMDAPPDLGELRAFLARRLPDPMLPAAVVTLPSLPLTAHGKIDRRALPAPEGAEVARRGFQAPETAVERFLAGLFGEVLKLGAVGVDDDFFALGGNSISGALLINRLQQELGEIVQVVVIFDHPTVGRLAGYLAEQHPAALGRLLPDSSAVPAAAPEAAERVDAAMVERMRQLIVPLEADRRPGAKNPPALFVLAPPRSGTTLLRVLLGGHPDLFAPPELELLSFANLAERRAAFAGRDSFWLEGLLRAVRELEDGDLAAAQAWMEENKLRELSTLELYGRLQERLGGRWLVDKTPSYALDPAILRRAEEGFAEPRYLHLLRHPYGMIHSFEEAKLDQIFFRRPHPFTRRQLAELIWQVSHRNVQEFLAGVPAGRRHTVRFEELVAEPERVLRGICDFLGIDYQPGMAQPYAGGSARMTDGIHAASRMLGDVKFHQHAGIDAATADRWRSQLTADFLGEPARELAAELGYELPGTGRPAQALVPGAWRPGAPLPLSFGQERLWVLDQFDPGSPTYNVFAGIKLHGRLEIHPFVAGLGIVVSRHATLRTLFGFADGQPVQRIQARSEPAWALVDLGALGSADRREAEARRLVTAESLRPFDLARGPLLRTRLFRLAADQHVAAFTAQHIVCDGWSTGLFLQELATAYTALLAGREARLPELPIQYVDYAIWQRGALAGEALDRQLDFWRRELAGVPVLQMPTDRPRPAIQTSHGATLPFQLPAEVSQGLRRLARENATTGFVVVLALFQALLSRYSGSDDVAVGSPVSGRNRPEVERLIGFFVNTLTLRADLSGGPLFHELLQRTRRTVMGAFAHQDLPFERVVQELAPQRSLSHAPLFQAMLAFQNQMRESAVEFPGLTLEPLTEEGETAKFDLSLNVFDLKDSSSHFGRWAYNTDLFDGATAERWSRHLIVLAEQLLAHPDRALAELPLLTPEERRELLIEANRPQLAVEEPCPSHQLFLDQAAFTPDAVALVFAGTALSYGEVAARSDRLARRLRELGGGPEVAVGLRVERSPEMVIGLLGIWRSGSCYVPLDPQLPAERLAFLEADAGIELILTQDLLNVDLSAVGKAELPKVLPEQAAYRIYTSGSTGRPKGVTVSHRALANRLLYGKAADGDAAEVLLHKTTISFDVSLLELVSPLLIGGRIVLALPDAVQDTSYLVQTILEEGVTSTSFPPSLLAVVLGRGELSACTSLRQMITGGETVPPSLPGEFYRRLPRARLFNRYGPTETTISVTSWLCERGSAPWTLPIGRPIAGARLYLLSREGEPVPAGVVGEICVGGPGVSRGYHRLPALTAEQFVPDPFAADWGEAGGRLYRTGDLARFRPDGAVEFVGRGDQQVKIRGFRVELGEIEAALALHAAVREAAVVDRADGVSRRLAAYVVAQEGTTPSEDEMREFLRRSLPAYMVPADFVLLAELPVGASGKVNRQALPEPARKSVAADLVAPAGFVEELLAELWSEVLQRDAIGRHDNFFDLGGHSLLATQCLSRIVESFRVELPLRLFFERPTLAELAAEIEEASRAGHRTPIPPLTAQPRDGALPLSFAQERLWFLDQLEPGSSTYGMSTAMRLHGRLDIAALRASLQTVVDRHEVLRTTFTLEDGRPVQRIAGRLDLAFPLVDLRGLPAERTASATAELARREGRRSFDLLQGPLVRATLVALPDEHLALLQLHHAVADGWSFGVLVRELGELYRARVSGETPHLRPLPVQYADYALWQRGWLSGEILAEEIAYWRRQLSGMPALLALPTDRPRPSVTDSRAQSLAWRLDAEATRNFTLFCRGRGATLFIGLVAAFQALLHRYSGAADVPVGTPVAGRNRLEVEGLIGLFVNSLVLRGRIGDDPGFGDYLIRTRDTTLEAYAHQDVPFEKLVEELNPERSLAHSPLFQVLLTLQNTPRTELRLPGLTLSGYQDEAGAAKTDLDFGVVETGSGLAGQWLYRADLFDPSTLARMGAQLELLLRELPAARELPLSRLVLLTAEERSEIAAINATAAAFPVAPLPDLLRAQAARTPDATAVVSGDESLSYGELERRSSRLAARLRGFGVGPEQRVGVAVERSLELMVALRAVLAAGGAYVPIDPDYPAERILYMLADSAVPVLLTQRHLAERFPEPGAEILWMDDDLGAGTELAPVPADLDQLAYMIYTSGSTGRPKGAMNCHRGVVNRLFWMQQALGLTPEDRVLQKTPASFDVSVWELFWPLLQGACLVMAKPGGHQDPDYLAREIERQRVTTLHFVPSMLQAFVASLGSGFAGASVRRVVCSGEALPPELVERYYTHLAAPVFNLYGPTEAAVDVSWCPCPNSPDSPELASIPIGWPVANTALHVTDSWGSLLPSGIAGELFIGGVQVGRGYHGRPELTAERFLPDPFSPEPGARMYRTGDRVRRRAGGVLEFLGRADYQVKLRGFRIELGEIESAIAQCAGVLQTVALVRKDEPGQPRLVAYVVAESAVSSAELVQELRRKLPEYMVPSAWVFLPALPLTASGKVDRKLLPAPEGSRDESFGEYVPPRTPAERIVAEVWRSLLKLDRVGAEDDFFNLGGHSLLLVQVRSQLQAKFAHPLALEDLFRYRSVEALAAYLGEPIERETVISASLVELQPGREKLPLFVVHPLSGELMIYRHLVAAMGDERPLYGFQAPGFREGEVPLSSMRELADLYVADLLSFRPQGPYALAGSSLGGVIAFEMAGRLRARRYEVAFLGLLDSPAAFEDDPWQGPSAEIAILRYLKHGAAFVPDEDELMQMSLAERSRTLLSVGRSSGSLVASFSHADLQRLIRVVEANQTAMRTYRPEPRSEPAVYFQAEQGANEATVAAWRRLTHGELEVRVVPGNHQSMHLSANAPVLAAELRECLERVGKLVAG